VKKQRENIRNRFPKGWLWRRGYEKIALFDQYLAFSGKRYNGTRNRSIIANDLERSLAQISRAH